MPDRDYYEILGVARNSSEDEIKRAYRKMARKYHPDVNPGDKSAERKFKEIQEAYEVIGDPDKRKKYDQFGQAAFGPGGPGGGQTWTYRWSGQPGQGSPFEGFDFGVDLGRIFGGDFAGGAPFGPAGRGTREAGPQDLEVEVAVPFEVAARGGEVQITVKRDRGVRQGAESIAVKIPPGVSDGSRIRLRGQGHANAAGRAGDLYILPRVTPHPLFRRQGNDILMDLAVTVTEAALGTKVDVPTLDGLVTMTVPPGTSSGQRLRIRGRGIGKPGASRGDQYVEIKIVLPPKLDAESRELLKRFGERNPYNPRETRAS